MSVAGLNKRNAELIGLVCAAIILVGGSAVSQAARERTWQKVPADLYLVLIAFFIAHLILRFKAKDADPLLLPLGAVLATIGLIELRALGGPYLFSQQLWIALGVAAAVVVVLITREPDRLGLYKYLAGAFGVLL